MSVFVYARPRRSLSLRTYGDLRKLTEAGVWEIICGPGISASATMPLARIRRMSKWNSSCFLDSTAYIVGLRYKMSSSYLHSRQILCIVTVTRILRVLSLLGIFVIIAKILENFRHGPRFPFQMNFMVNHARIAR